MPDPHPEAADRVAQLEAVFDCVARTRMAGVPLLNPALRVRALGFAAGAREPDLLEGVLITPWFMNLLRLPRQAVAAAAPGWLAVGQSAARPVGPAAAGLRLDFIGRFEPGLGAFEAASLFSPMAEFTDQAAALAVAADVLRQLRQPHAAPAAPQTVPAPPSRRGFLFGRRGADAMAGAP